MVTKIDVWPLISKLMEVAREQKEYDFYGCWPIPKEQLDEILNEYIHIEVS